MLEKKPPLKSWDVNINQDLADQVTSGSTHDNRPRPSTSKPPLISTNVPLITPQDENSERPYNSNKQK